MKPLYRLLDDAAAANPEKEHDFQDKAILRRDQEPERPRREGFARGRVPAPGMKLGLFLPNRPYFVIFYYAGLKVPGARSSISTRSTPSRKWCARSADSRDRLVTLDLDVLLPKIRPCWERRA